MLNSNRQKVYESDREVKKQRIKSHERHQPPLKEPHPLKDSIYIPLTNKPDKPKKASPPKESFEEPEELPYDEKPLPAQSRAKSGNKAVFNDMDIIEGDEDE